MKVVRAPEGKEQVIALLQQAELEPLLITGNRDLLALNPYGSITILQPSGFLLF